MNIKRAKEEIKNTMESYLLKDAFGDYVIPAVHQRPILLLGAPGIGKTQIMEQIARECQVGLVSYTITHHTRQSAIGLPFISKKDFGGREYSVTEYTMSEIVASVYEKIEKTGIREGILFIDEVNCVSETLAPAMLQFLQYKSFGSHRIPRGWIIAAAGNPPEYNKSVREFDVVTMDRVKKIEVEPDYGVWKEYAAQTAIHPAVTAYLDLRPQYFYRMETTVDGRRFATPRGWEDLSRLLCVYETLNKQVDREVAVQYIQHEKIAGDFANYLELYTKYRMDYALDQVFCGHIDENLVKKASHASFDERLSVVSLLLGHCTSQFRRLYFREQVADRLLEQLRSFKDALSSLPETAPPSSHWFTSLFEKMCSDYDAELAHQREAELLTREQEQIWRQTSRILNDYCRTLCSSGPQSTESALECIQEQFKQETAAIAELQEQSGQMLEYAFDFLEAAFVQGQELVIFITELNSNPYSISFLQEYECQRYYQYNKELLFREKDRSILAKLDELNC